MTYCGINQLISNNNWHKEIHIIYLCWPIAAFLFHIFVGDLCWIILTCVWFSFLLELRGFKLWLSYFFCFCICLFVCVLIVYFLSYWYHLIGEILKQWFIVNFIHHFWLLTTLLMLGLSLNSEIWSELIKLNFTTTISYRIILYNESCHLYVAYPRNCETDVTILVILIFCLYKCNLFLTLSCLEYTECSKVDFCSCNKVKKNVDLQ